MTEPRRPNPIIALLLFLTATFLVGFVGAQGTMRGLDFWYITLAKPSWAPPGWVFAPVWTVLYFLMAVAAWQVWRVPEGELPSGRRSAALACFGSQLLLNGLWPWLFCGFQRINLALYEIGVLLLAVVGTTVLFFRAQRSAGWMMVPYVAWLLFATALNFAFWRLNPVGGVQMPVPVNP
ncbi:MAG: TspO/MBR family protein [Fimbriimonas sp.]